MDRRSLKAFSGSPQGAGAEGGEGRVVRDEDEVFDFGLRGKKAVEGIAMGGNMQG